MRERAGLGAGYPGGRGRRGSFGGGWGRDEVARSCCGRG